MSALKLIQNARVVAPGSPDAPARPAPVDVLVADERVAAVAPGLAAAFASPVAAGLVEVVDVAGRLVAPGLIDAHVHLTGGGGESGFASRVPRVMLSALASAGVTSVVGVLGTDGATRTMRDLVATTLGLREEGLSAWCYTGNYAVPVVTLTGSVKDDVVFVDPVVGVGELAVSDHRSSQPTLAELLRVASDAYVGGLTAGKAGIVHLHLGDGARGLDLVRRALAEAEIPARVWQPTHLNRNPTLWREAMDLAAAGGALPYFDVTAFPADDLGGALSAADAIAAWHRAGLPLGRLTCSSDGGGCLPTFDADGRLVAMGVGASATLLETVRALVAAGVPLVAALAPVTVNPARALLLDARKGAVAPGWDADLLVFDTDDAADARLPLAAVMARGRWLVAGGELLAAGRGAFEAGPGTGGGA
ncbi:MAG: beta-aspartyl-peptidase [Deltaproteobacteria bacterium]|nr:beta-aspartyl-peptidase [Deltaproteobacteria bacterium]